MLAVELRPAEWTYRAMRARRWRRWGMVIAVAVVPLALVLAVDWLQRSDLRERINEKARLEAQLVAARQRFKSASAEAEELLAQIQRADALRSKRSWSDLLALIGAAVPQRGWLTLLTTEPAQPAGEVVKTVATPTTAAAGAARPALVIEAPRELRISGYAGSPAEPSAMVSGLRSTRVFARVELLQCRQEPVHDGSYYRFDIVCKW